MRDIAAVAQASGHAGSEQNRHEQLHVYSFAPARALRQKNARERCFGIVLSAYSGRQSKSYTMSAAMEEQGSVSVAGAERAQAPVIQNLMQLYTHDFSEFWAGTSRGDLNAHGLFDAYPLNEYWSEANWAAMLICCDRVLAGFCLVNDRTHSGLGAQRNMAEFFILRKYRGRGLGRLAAEIVFSRQPGLWEVAVARKNARAREFWRKTIERSPASSQFQELDLQDERWDGPIFRFEWGL
jgi:predicted acetyltransferase